MFSSQNKVLLLTQLKVIIFIFFIFAQNFPVFVAYQSDISFHDNLYFSKYCSKLNMIILPTTTEDKSSLISYESSITGNKIQVEDFDQKPNFYSVSYFYKIFEHDLKNHTSLKRPTLQNTRNCIDTKITFLSNIPDNALEHLTRILMPVVKPMMYKDREKVILAFSEKSSLESTLKSPFGRKLKYKVGVIQNSNRMELFSSCEFCTKKAPFLIKSSGVPKWPDYENNFEGAKFRVCTPTSSRPRFNYTFSNGKYQPANGLLVYAVKYIQERLNFTLGLKPASRGGGTGIKLPNGSWTGVMSDILYGDADIGMCTAETYSRTLVAGFSPAVVLEPITFVSGPPKKIFAWEAIAWPFKGEVWVTLAALTIASVSLILVSNHVIPVPENSKWKLGKIIEYMTAVLLDQGTDLPRVQPLAVSVYLTFWLICGFIIETAYLSQLVGFLTFPLFDKIPQTGEELVASEYTWGLTYMGGAAYSLIKASKTQTYDKIVRKMELTTDHIRCLTRTLDSRFICISYETIPKFYVNSQLHVKPGQSLLAVSQNYFLSIPVGIAMEKRAVFAPNVDKAIRRFTEAGLIPQWEKQDFRKIRQKILQNSFKKKIGPKTAPIADDATDEDGLLTLKHLHGSFIILGGGTLLSLLMFFWEMRTYINATLRKVTPSILKRHQVVIQQTRSKVMIVEEAKEYEDF